MVMIYRCQACIDGKHGECEIGHPCPPGQYGGTKCGCGCGGDENYGKQSKALENLFFNPEDFMNVLQKQKYPHPIRTAPAGFKIVERSIFDIPADAFVNTINCVGIMGAGIALEFKKRFPKMYEDYKLQCSKHLIKPGDCYTYLDDENHVYLLGLAVKDDWRHWSTLEWIKWSIKSLKLAILENDIKSVNMPLIGGLNGRRGPYGKVLEPRGLTPPPNCAELKLLLEKELRTFSEKFGVGINLCIPDEKSVKKELTLLDFCK